LQPAHMHLGAQPRMRQDSELGVSLEQHLRWLFAAGRCSHQPTHRSHTTRIAHTILKVLTRYARYSPQHRCLMRIAIADAGSAGAAVAKPAAAQVCARGWVFLCGCPSVC
jgi:hypothetical protein